MLTDSQIERYSRQIVLPEVGGRGQERLLAASVAIGGGGDGALFCAAHLAAAGVGRLHLDRIDAGSPLAAALSLFTRNADCTIDLAPPERADATILVGEVVPDTAPSGVLVWGCDGAEGIVAARFPSNRGCVACLAALGAVRDTGSGSAQLVGTLLALLGLRALLGVGSNDPPQLLRFTADTPSLVTVPFPSRPGCPLCA